MDIVKIIEYNSVWIIIGIFLFEIIILFLLTFLLLKIREIRVKNRKFFSGKEGVDLENVIIKIKEDIKMIDGEIQELYNISNETYKISMQSIRKVEVIRFNPFKDIGGNQSFSIAFLNGKNSGVVMSALHTKDGTRVYSKPIIQGKAEKYPLTEEEERVIKKASGLNE